MRLSKAVEEFLTDTRLRGLSPETVRRYGSDLGLLVALAELDGEASVIAFTADLARSYCPPVHEGPLEGHPAQPARQRERVRPVGGCAGASGRSTRCSTFPTSSGRSTCRARSRPTSASGSRPSSCLRPSGSSADCSTTRDLRVTPICGIRLRDITTVPVRLATGVEVPGTIRTVGKGNKTSVKPLLPELHELVVGWVLGQKILDPRSFLLSQKDGRPLTRKIVERRTADWGDRAGVADCTPHRFRHTFATWLLEKSVDVRVIQVLMDHADISTTAGYTKVLDEQAFGALLMLSARANVSPGATGQGVRPEARQSGEDGSPRAEILPRRADSGVLSPVAGGEDGTGGEDVDDRW